MADSHREPLVSVVIPSFRATEYLGEALESVFRQSYPHLEVIVVDQDQNDDADRVLRPVEHRIRRLRLSPPSVSAARNLAILEARGSIIAQLDADDIWEEHAVRILTDTLFSRKADLVFGNAVFIGDVSVAGKTFREFFPAHRPVTYDDVARRHTNIFVSVAGKRGAFIDAGLYDPAFRFGEDLDLWLRMLLRGTRMDFTDEVICQYRRRPEAACSEPIVERLRKLTLIYDKHLSLPGVSQSSRDVLESMRTEVVSALSIEESKLAIANGEYRLANRILQGVSSSQMRPSVRMASLALAACPPLAGPLVRAWMRAGATKTGVLP